MAVVSFSGLRHRILAPWIQDTDTLEQLFADAARKKVSLISANVYNITAEQRIGGLGDSAEGGGRGASGSAAIGETTRLAQRQERGDLGGVLQQVEELLYAFSETPGRKVALLLSGGWPIGLDSKFGDVYPLRALTETSNLLGWSFYPVHLSRPADHLGALPGPGWLRHMRLQESLIGVAAATGGKHMVFGGDHYLSRAEEDLRSYYRLGIPLTTKLEEGSSSIEVEILQSGYEARYRSSFLAIPSHTESMRKARARLLTEQASLRKGLRVSAGEPYRVAFRQVALPIAIEIPHDLLVFIEEENRFVAKIDVLLIARNDIGERSPGPNIPFEIELPTQPLSGSSSVVKAEIRLWRQHQTLKVAVYDRLGDKLLGAELEVDF
jgi:hypothetical protein